MNELILINGKGEEYNLFDERRSPAFGVDGWGYEDITDFLQIGNSYYPLDKKTAQRTISLTLSFYGEADKRYRAFIDFVQRDPLLMRYTNDVGQYFVPCRLRTITKPDQPRYKQYSCPVTFALMGNLYKITSDYNAGEVGTGKSYGETGYTYDYTYSAGILNTVELRSDSYLESPCVLTLYGELTNPIWRHYLNGNLVEVGAYTGTIPAGNYIVIDSKSVPYSVIEYDSAGHVVGDRYQLCDFSTERFMHIGEGQNSYVVSHDNLSPASLKAEAYIEYETV